jgi:transglutaminase-like putative cysteine protease
MMVADFQNTITLGSALLGMIGAVGVAVGLIYGVRYRVAYEAASAAADELRKSVADCREHVAKQEILLAAVRGQLSASHVTISRLEAQPDMDGLVRMLEKHDVEIAARLEAHEARADERALREERRAQERQEQQAAVMNALAQKIIDSSKPTQTGRR